MHCHPPLLYQKSQINLMYTEASISTIVYKNVHTESLINSNNYYSGEMKMSSILVYELYSSS